MKLSDLALGSADTAADASAAKPACPPQTIPERFAEVMEFAGDRLAVFDEQGACSYAGLDAWSDRVATFLRQLNLPAESCVGLMIDRHRGFIASMLGVLKAGHVYVPIDPAWPRSRKRHVVDTADISVLISETSSIRDLHWLQWRCPSVSHIVCGDAGNIDGVAERPGELMSVELWDHLAGEAADDVEAGGWKSAFTGEPLAEAALHAFGDNAASKVKSLFAQKPRVLEIGCASGFTMRHIAPHASSYIVTDISRRNVERALANARAAGHDHVSGRPLAAHDVEIFEEGSFDLVVMNSVVESFPGFGYLRDVLKTAQTLLAPGGAIFMGNVWDMDRFDAYEADIAAAARRGDFKVGSRSHLDPSEDLFIPRAFLLDWARETGAKLEFSDLDAPGFEPAAYTYDVVIRPGEAEVSAPRVHRHDARSFALNPETAADVGLTPQSGAYILFTSGTTGRPKGVMVQHHSVVNLASAESDVVLEPLKPEHGLEIASVASFTFDSSILQIYLTLLNGHTLHVASETTRRDPELLNQFFEERRVDHVNLTPTMFSMLIDRWTETNADSCVRCYELGGEVVTEAMLRSFYARDGHRDARVVNAYGPTEACVAATLYVMTEKSWQDRLPPPIGEPFAGVKVRIADRSGRAIDKGLPGELLIGGTGVARGYVGDPALTEERFVTVDGERYYRTGDVARLGNDGVVHYMGRQDRQVKISGHRIEPGEVETALESAPAIRRAAVIGRKLGENGPDALVAYVVTGEGFDVDLVQTVISTSLPTYMVPSFIVPVEDLPMTQNGKLDVAKLPVPEEAAMGGTSRPKRALETDAEIKMAAIWSEVLGRTVDDADGDFFELGGHSVLAVRLISAIEKEFGTRLPVAELFQHSTVSAVTNQITQVLPEQRNPLVAVHPDGGNVPMVCFHPVGGNVLCYQGLAQELGSDQPVYMVEASGLEPGQSLQPTVETMVDAYLASIDEMLPSGPIIFAGWSFGGLLAYEAAARSQRRGRAVHAVLLFDSIGDPGPVRDLLRMDEADYLAALFDEMGTIDADSLRGLGAEDRLDLLIEKGQEGDFLPAGIDRDGMRRLLAVFQNNALACVRYRPPKIDGPMLLVRPREFSKQAPGVPGDDYNAWKELPSGGVDLRWMGGTHGQMLAPSHIGELAQHVKDYLAAQSVGAREAS